MAFDANRDIKIEASQGEDGSFTLRTKGLADRKRPELEIVGAPEPALRAAANVLNDVADYTVNKAEVLADQNVGFGMESPGEGDRSLMLVVSAVATAAPSGGLWSKITGGGKGVLRLVDVVGEKNAPPRTALATMLVHRARVRLSQEDPAGARAELQAAIATLPGEKNAGRAPKVGDWRECDFNWQNHLAYLALADLDDDPAQYAEALSRSDDFAERELGATLASIDTSDAARLEALAKEIVDTNVDPDRRPGPSDALAIVASPIWEVEPDGGHARRATLIPKAFTELYYEGRAAERLRASGAKLAARALAGRDAATLAWRTRVTRNMWSSFDAPFGKRLERYAPAQGVLSAILAGIARCFRADATEDEIAAYLAGESSQSFDEKIAALESWEGEQYMSAMSM
jgi:hypothetical protein